MADEGEKKARTSFRKFTYRSALQKSSMSPSQDDSAYFWIFF
jgi:hypothetical protein